jgi:LacI family repressor for deo operon, udp, cdd, tsx, nupC, and nupG
VPAAQNEEGSEVAPTGNVTAVKKSLSATGRTTPSSVYSVPGEGASASTPGTLPPLGDGRQRTGVRRAPTRKGRTKREGDENVKQIGQRVTIDQVAKEAGVSTATVSRVLAGIGSVNATMAAEVRRVASTLGYRPFGAARDLASGHHRSIGVVVPDLANPYFYDIISSAQAAAAKDGYRMLIADSGGDPETELSMCEDLLSQAGGLIVQSSRMDAAGLKSLVAHNSPVVLINRVEYGVDLPTVGVDNFSAMLEICHHLTSLGHRKAVYLAGPASSWQNQERWRAIQQARMMGLESTSLSAEPTIEGGYAATDAVLAEGPTAIIAFNDLVACGVLARLRERGLRVPEDMSVTGFDDIVFAKFTQPALTTAVTPRAVLGEQAWKILRARLNGYVVPEVPLVKAEVVIRDSTAAPPGL